MNDCSSDEHLDDPAIRADLVERVRREIAAGTYETPEKWDAALDRLLERLQKEDS
jgi:negative regulator of flagellin synthesis FlgM